MELDVTINRERDSVGLTCSEVKRTSLGAAAMPLVLTSGKNLYLAIITLYMLEIAPPAETRWDLSAVKTMCSGPQRREALPVVPDEL